ncbi:hypothetical protein HMPREF0454_01339 [Hafnia alvei ATCC 51873]|uniref:Uncharacterized protein n=1 Tax=Hafnia alvei ATCC 51873 TaxID=1002364 RepID=G9Y458_HAFAL|nr:hypothetical protein HMPREF0454_01339 [Hafnia alvei ATCC 51873]
MISIPFLRSFPKLINEAVLRSVICYCAASLLPTLIITIVV